MKRIISTILSLFVTFISFAQINPQGMLERDPSVRYGKFENGLTYYIKHNDKPAERADYYLFTNVGAIQETPAQNGLAHFLEHMALNGTKNLPGKMMINYFESIGASFGANINASTGVEQTMYMLNNIPTTREGIIDTALLIMHDYSAFVTNDPVEIDKERGVIIEEWRTRRTAEWRSTEKAWEHFYKGSKYATCNIIGTKENLETFPASELQDFYHTWYRPDLQAIVVVGDIDPEVIEAKLRELFKDIPAHENPKPKEEILLPENEEPIVGIIIDPETRMSQVQFVVKYPLLTPRMVRRYGAGFMNDLAVDLVNAVFSERFDDIRKKADAPFFAGGAAFTNLILTSDALMASAAFRDGEALTAFEAALTEIEKAKRFGFTESELERAKTNMIANAERATSNAESRKNGEYVRDFMSDFFQGWPFMTPAYKEEQIKGYLPYLSADVINAFLKTISYDKNVVVLYLAPEREGLVHPVEQDFITIIDKVKNAEMESGIQEEELGELVDAALLIGSKVREEKEGRFNSTAWTLENGIRVIVRPSDYKKEEVTFRLQVPGGKSLIAESELPSVDDNMIALYSNLGGVSNFSSTTLNKMLTGIIVSESPFIEDEFHGIAGQSAPKDFETLMQLVYLQVTEPRFVEEEIAPAFAQMNAIVPNLSKQPNYILSEAYLKTAYGNNPRRQLISMDMLSKMSVASLEQSYKTLFSNMAGACVYITGNVDLETIKPLVEKYIGSLPTAGQGSTYIDHNLQVVPGKVENVFNAPMTTPKSSVLMIYSGDVEYDLENVLTMQAFRYVLDLVYTETIREDEGATYGVGTQGSVSAIPQNRGEMLIQFDTDPARAEDMIKLAIKGVEDIANNGPSEEQMVKVRENFLKNVSESRINNSYWSNNLRQYDLTGVDLDTEREAIINSLTAEKVKNFVADLIGQGNLVKIVMNPEE
jgi:zinc protease